VKRAFSVGRRKAGDLAAYNMAAQLIVSPQPMDTLELSIAGLDPFPRARNYSFRLIVEMLGFY
jgi:hypothetical protein